MSDVNTQVIDEFRDNEGRVGGKFEGAPMIIVHSLGARSGAVREIPLVYFPQEDGSMVIVASAAGAPKHPAWYHNLKATPAVDVEVGTATFPVRADEIVGAERDGIWDTIASASPGFAAYQEKIERTIPLFRLNRV